MICWNLGKIRLPKNSIFSIGNRFIKWGEDWNDELNKYVSVLTIQISLKKTNECLERTFILVIDVS